MTGNLRVLISNDDGIDSPGLAVLVGIARNITDDIWVVAPESEQSGAAHSLTLTKPLRLRQVGERRYAVLGTPTDCVMLAVYHLMRRQKRPDLLLSGINLGGNLGEDVTYSGTVAAAIEGTLLGIRSIALSQVAQLDKDREWPVRWETAEHYGPEVIDKLLAMEDWPGGVLMNVNFPDAVPDDVTKMAATMQGQRDTRDLTIDERIDPRGVPYYWIGFRTSPGFSGTNTDFDAVARGGISVTPLRVNMSDASVRERLCTALK